MKTDNIEKNVRKSIFAVGFTTLLVAISSTAFFSIYPFYVRDILGVGIVAIGLVENITEFLSQIFRLFSGIISDYMKRHKPMFLLGTIFSAVARPFFIFGNNIGMIAASKTLDRLGNGISATPRDAYIAQYSPKDKKGAYIGIIMTFKTIGCVIGPFSVMLIMSLCFGMSLKKLTIIMSIPSFIAVFVCWMYMKERPMASADDVEHLKHSLQMKDITSLPKTFWMFLSIMTLFMIARVPESYLLLTLNDSGLPMWFCSGAIGVFNLMAVLVSYPAGKLSDKFGRLNVLIFSFISLILSLFFMSVNSKTLCVLAVIFWGFQRSTSQILSVSCISDIVKKNILGTAIGLLNLLNGFAAIISGCISGYIAKEYNFFVSFKMATLMSCVALCFLFVFSKRVSLRQTKQNNK